MNTIIDYLLIVVLLAVLVYVVMWIVFTVRMLRDDR